MTVDLAALTGRTVSRETLAKIERYVRLLEEESGRQNLVARSTLNEVWARHIADSAQLVRFEPKPGSSWVDVGSGAGLPGIIVACLVNGPVELVEPRTLRADFLDRAVRELALGERVCVTRAKAQSMAGHFDVITARAVASVDALLGMTLHLSHPDTLWVLPRGRNAKSELAEARRSWQCDASSEGSLTDPESEVLVLRNVRPKGRG